MPSRVFLFFTGIPPPSAQAGAVAGDKPYSIIFKPFETNYD